MAIITVNLNKNEFLELYMAVENVLLGSVYLLSVAFLHISLTTFFSVFCNIKLFQFHYKLNLLFFWIMHGRGVTKLCYGVYLNNENLHFIINISTYDHSLYNLVTMSSYKIVCSLRSSAVIYKTMNILLLPSLHIAHNI